MNREDLKKLMPHREPMLLVDTAEVIDGEARGTYRVRGDEWFLQGHFPGNPVVPGVVLLEIMAQTCCVLLSGDGDAQGATPYYTGLDHVRFKEQVRPGDTLELTCKITKKKSVFRFAEGKACVRGRVAAQAEFSFALVK